MQSLKLGIGELILAYEPSSLCIYPGALREFPPRGVGVKIEGTFYSSKNFHVNLREGFF